MNRFASPDLFRQAKGFKDGVFVHCVQTCYLTTTQDVSQALCGFKFATTFGLKYVNSLIFMQLKQQWIDLPVHIQSHMLRVPMRYISQHYVPMIYPNNIFISFQQNFRQIH
jgi:hypothetical protein